MSKKPTVLFGCVHNAGRSQMAAGFMRELGGDRVEVLSAGSAPKDSINPIAVAAMAEVGIDITNQQTHPMRYAQLVAHNADFQDAAAQAQKKINTWKYNYKYEKNMRTQNGQYDNRWRASNVDIMFNRAFSSGYIDNQNRLRFMFSGKNKIVNIKILLKPSDNIVKHDSNGRVMRKTEPRTWTVDSIDVDFSWASLGKNGLTGNTATAFLIRDASKGDSQISVNNASVFKPNDQVFIASSQSVGSENVDEAVYEADLYVEKIIDNQNILLKSPLRFNWDMTRNPFVRLKSDKSEKIPEYISEVGGDCLEDQITVSKNIKNTANLPSGPFTTLSSSYLEDKDREDISLAASIVREELAENFHLLKPLLELCADVVFWLSHIVEPGQVAYVVHRL
jgi:hypothetical protein